MPIKPGKNESQSEWMDRCMHDMFTGDRTREQATAACLQMWRDRDKAAVVKQPEPEPGESHDEFISRCVDEIDDEEECQIIWENRSVAAVIHKTHAGQIDGSEYILSDETVDRMGDIIVASGWRLDNFKRNPIALFSHVAGFPIGRWRDLRIEGNSLRGHLELAPAGTSERIDEIRRLVKAGILKAVSVGFKPLKHEPLDEKQPWKGSRFLEQELVETSLVSVPANPNALAVAKSLDISAETLGLVFAGQGKKDGRQVMRRSNGGQADPPRIRTTKMSLSQNIQELQGQLNMLTDSLQQHQASLDNDDVSDEQMAATDDFHKKIAKKKRQLDQAIESEKLLGQRTVDEHGDGVHEVRMPTRIIPKMPNGLPRVYPEVAKKDQPGDNIFRALTCLVKLQSDRYLGKKSHLDVIRDTYGENEKVRAAFEAYTGKAATLPAVTTPAQVGWAPELVRTEYAAWMESLQPAAVTMRLLGQGLTFTFGANGIISIPSRLATPTIAGSFVGEAAPIPVRQGAFTAITLVPKKLAVITVFSREISEHSTPAIEGLLRNAIIEDTAVALDTVLLDANAATTVRPAGLRSGVSTLTPTAGGGFTAIVGDIKLLVAALTTATLGNIRNPVWLMSPLLELGLRLAVAPNGTWAFRDEINGGRFNGWPVIVSSNVTADTLYLIDAADLISASGPPNFSVSDSATVHMEDTTPLQIGTAGTPATVAAPTRSFWQTDTLGIRMIMQMNWGLRRTGMVQYITGTTWD